MEADAVREPSPSPERSPAWTEHDAAAPPGHDSSVIRLAVAAPDGVLDDALARVRAGDAAAYATVVRQCTPALRAWTRLRAPAGIDADEIVHQAFITAFDQLGRYQPELPFPSWLLGIARRLLLSETRALRRRQAHHQRYAEATGRVVAVSTEEREDARIEAMRRCIARLGRTAQDLVHLRYREGLPVVEIARRLGRSPGAVAKHLHHIRHRLLAQWPAAVAAIEA